MEKVWFIRIDEAAEGPYSIDDLKRNRNITPDTLAWKEGFENWKPIREIPELVDLFHEEPPAQENEEEPKSERSYSQDELALDWSREPPFLFWIIVVAIVIAYVLSQLYWK